MKGLSLGSSRGRYHKAGMCDKHFRWRRMQERVCR